MLSFHVILNLSINARPWILVIQASYVYTQLLMELEAVG